MTQPDTASPADDLRNQQHWAAIADDYETLTSADFDAKYPDWANSEVFDRELRREFERRRRGTR